MLTIAYVNEVLYDSNTAHNTKQKKNILTHVT